MLSKKSIRYKFASQLVLASATLIVIFSTILYNYIKINIYENLTAELQKKANFIAKDYYKNNSKLNYNTYQNTTIKLRIDPNEKFKISFSQNKVNDNYFLNIKYPIKKETFTFLYISEEITNSNTLLNSILQNILVINFTAIFLILFYALLLSKMLIIPINSLTHKLASMDENFLQSINTKNIPDEFEPLANSINKLVDRIYTFARYQKELFIGTAHELKTPLAVMKTTNEVTLLKQRDVPRYINALKTNNDTIDEMNKMITNILEIGRQEGAQFEQPIRIDLIKFLKQRFNNFKMLAAQKEKILKADLSPSLFPILIQQTLLIHILQNFVQNAIKFTPINGEITIKSFTDDDGINIHVIDSGVGIDESQDLFAPFKRFGGKEGAGLGLFLAKNAADAIGATIGIKNRDDQKGAIAYLHIPLSNKKSTKFSKKHTL